MVITYESTGECPRAGASARSGPLNQTDALAVVLEATLEWVVREVAGNRND